MDPMIKEYLSYLSQVKKVSPNTLESYRRDILKYHDYMTKVQMRDLCAANRTIILDFLLTMQKQGMATSSILRMLASLRSLYRFLLQKQYISENPAEEIHGFKSEKKTPQILTDQEVERLLEQPVCKDFKGYRDCAMLELLYATGMRVSELISLKVSDVNLEIGYINCFHGGENRVIPIHTTARDKITAYLRHGRSKLPQIADDDILFLNLNGAMLTRQGFWKIMKYYQKKAKITTDITPHMLRRTFAIRFLENGADLKSIQSILGHKDIASTQFYAQIVKRKLADTYYRAHPRAKSK